MPFDFADALEDFWGFYAEAGWVTTTTVFPYSSATDTVSGTGTDCDAIYRAVDRKEDDETFTARRRWHLRASDLTGVAVQKRAVIEAADGSRWKVESVKDCALKTRYECDTVRI